MGLLTEFFRKKRINNVEFFIAQSNHYQALLYHAWKCNRQQAKGLKRQAAKIKRLKQRINELENAN